MISYLHHFVCADGQWGLQAMAVLACTDGCIGFTSIHSKVRAVLLRPHGGSVSATEHVFHRNKPGSQCQPVQSCDSMHWRLGACQRAGTGMPQHVVCTTQCQATSPSHECLMGCPMPYSLQESCSWLCPHTGDDGGTSCSGAAWRQHLGNLQPVAAGG